MTATWLGILTIAELLKHCDCFIQCIHMNKPKVQFYTSVFFSIRYSKEGYKKHTNIYHNSMCYLDPN